MGKEWFRQTKRFTTAELREIKQSSGILSADKDSVEGSSVKDISESMLKYFLFKRYTNELFNAGIFSHLVQSTDIEDIVQAIDANLTIEKLLINISLMDEAGQLTLSGLLLLGKSIQRYRPSFTIKGVSFVGNNVATTEFRDKLPDREVEGSLLKQYEASISFINRNLKTIQVDKEFNSAGRLEIPVEVFVETLTNAFIHRDYHINSPIRLFVFDNRIEIHSPGILPVSVTEDSIKQGISAPRNQLLFDHATYLLPCTGIGSGIMRAMKCYHNILFQNNVATEEFVITILREETIRKANEGVYLTSDGFNDQNNMTNNRNDHVNPDNDHVKDIFDRVFFDNDRVKHKLIPVYSYIKENRLVKIASLVQLTNKSDKTVRRYIKKLKDNGLIEYIGSDKTGGYSVVTKNSTG